MRAGQLFSSRLRAQRSNASSLRHFYLGGAENSPRDSARPYSLYHSYPQGMVLVCIVLLHAIPYLTKTNQPIIVPCIALDIHNLSGLLSGSFIRRQRIALLSTCYSCFPTMLPHWMPDKMFSNWLDFYVSFRSLITFLFPTDHLL
jgi:hypothetical protein